MSGAAGIGLRWAFLDHHGPDAFTFLLPWYELARDRGVEILGEGFTNYAPFYGYLLLLVAQLDGLAQPLHLIKFISFIFEFLSALVSHRLVLFATGSAIRAQAAFACCWLAPTVLLNGALWGQADAVWSFFVILSIYRFCRGSNGVIPFGIAFSVKAQGVFLGPFILGLLLRHRWRWTWIASIPAVYLVIALPTVFAGRSLFDVATIYLDQAGTFRALSMNAANFWVVVSPVFYREAVVAGLLVAFMAGLWLAVSVARSSRKGPDFLILAACVSLLAMPYLLPKMHERYFYGFELASIALAFISPRYLMVPIMAQVNGMLAYSAIDRAFGYDLLAAALGNTVLLIFLVRRFRGEGTQARPSGRNVAGYFLLCSAFAIQLAVVGNNPQSVPATAIAMLLTVLLTVQAYVVLERTTTATE